MNDEDFKRLERIVPNFKKEVKTEFRHQFQIHSEPVMRKLDPFIEGNQMLSEKIDRMEQRLDGRLDCVLSKLDTVAADLSAHRADTEVPK